MRWLRSIGKLLVKMGRFLLKTSYTLGYLIGLAATAVLIFKTNEVARDWALVIFAILAINVCGRFISLLIFLFTVQERGWEDLAKRIGSRFPKILIWIGPDSKMEGFLNRIGLSYWKYLGTTGCELFWSSIRAGINSSFLPIKATRILLITGFIFAAVYFSGFALIFLFQKDKEVVLGEVILLVVLSLALAVLWGLGNLLFFLTKMAAKFFCPIKFEPQETSYRRDHGHPPKL